MELVYILLIGIVVYYLVTRLFENYSTQEDFDPSLVPVSSIVTLAKIAQKLVDGGGTLTNPGNLTVTGNLIVNGDVTINGANLKLPINNFIRDNQNNRRLLYNINNTAGNGPNAPSYDNYYYTGPAPAASGSVKPTFAHIFKTSDDKPGTINCGNITCGEITSNGTISNNNIRITDRISMKNQANIFAVINAGNDLEVNKDSLIFWKGAEEGKLTIVGHTGNDYTWSGAIGLNGKTGLITATTLNVSGKIDTQGGLSINSNLNEAINCGGINTNSKNITCGGSITCTSISCNNITNKKSGWDYNFTCITVEDSGVGWSNKSDPSTANNNGWMSWTGTGIDPDTSHWFCPTTGIWIVEWWLDVKVGNFAIINETARSIVCIGYGTSYVNLSAGDKILGTGFWINGGRATIGGNKGYWRMKLFLKL